MHDTQWIRIRVIYHQSRVIPGWYVTGVVSIMM